MSRPCKRRRICAEPECISFAPADKEGVQRERVNMTLDEYEAIRLIDLLGYTQEECALQMNVSRTTAQAIYSSARKKSAECLVMGKELIIDGGDYVICDKNNEGCKSKKCCRKEETERRSK